MFIKIIVAFFIAILLSACGGGSSSSGADAPPITLIKYQGTFSVGVLRGSIEMEIRGSVVTVAFGGVPCLQGAYTEGISTTLANSTRVTNGRLQGAAPNFAGVPAGFRASFPDSGGEGSIDLTTACGTAPMGMITVQRV